MLTGCQHAESVGNTNMMLLFMQVTCVNGLRCTARPHASLRGELHDLRKSEKDSTLEASLFADINGE